MESGPFMSQAVYTLGAPLGFEGIGLHSGVPARLRLLPSDRPGYWLYSDVHPQGVLMACEHVQSTQRCTRLAGVDTVEHVLAALYGLGYGAAELWLEGPECPILDGSAQPFAKALWETPQAPVALPFQRRPLTLKQPFTLGDPDTGSWCVQVVPAPVLSVHYVIDFSLLQPTSVAQRYQRQAHYEHQCVQPERGGQGNAFLKHIAPARTFVFAHEIQALQAAGQALGGSLDNAVVLDAQGQALRPQRFDDEPVHHKILDFLGDLALLGADIDVQASVQIYKGGHTAHVKLVEHLQGFI